MSCSCCGEDKPTASLRSRDDVEVCRDCLEWLLGRVGVTATPTLPVADMAEATAFYERAGFGVRQYRDDEGEPGEGFAFVNTTARACSTSTPSPTSTRPPTELAAT